MVTSSFPSGMTFAPTCVVNAAFPNERRVEFGGMMPGESLANRVERLEKTVDGLQTLPAEVAALGERVGAVELQILQLRTDMNDGFSAVRSEMTAEFAAVRTEIQAGFAAAREEWRVDIRTESAALRAEMQAGFAAARDERLVALANVTTELGRQIQEAAEEGKRHTRVLFEEVLSRIATLGEHRESSIGRKPRSRGKR